MPRQPQTPLLQLLTVLIPLSVLSTTYLYLYPAFHRCSFPAPQTTEPRSPAPFRLLALGDPQLEGDTSLPPLPHAPNATLLETGPPYRRVLHWLQASVLEPRLLHPLRLTAYYAASARKSLDLWGNDFYLAHVYRSVKWWTEPTHVVVLGDLLGSQWIGDDEFARRSERFWGRVFKGGSKVEDERLGWKTVEDAEGSGDRYILSPDSEVLGEHPKWASRIINVAGNHDIGYSGDLNDARAERFEREFGPLNGEITFHLPFETSEGQAPSLRLIVLNSMNLDSPAFDGDVQQDTYAFINEAIMSSQPVEAHTTATILLTHIPLHKSAGVCIDAPLMHYYEGQWGGGVREQNFISQDASRDVVLQGLFGFTPDENAPARGMGRDGIILTGHDHEGCDVYHFANRSSGEWQALRWKDEMTARLAEDDDVPGIREVTVRSMMGEFAGYSGLVAAWWDSDKGRWKIEVEMCRFQVQHVWWAVHVLDSITLGVVALSVMYALVGKMSGSTWTSDSKTSAKTMAGKAKAEKKRPQMENSKRKAN